MAKTLLRHQLNPMQEICRKLFGMSLVQWLFVFPIPVIMSISLYHIHDVLTGITM